MHSNTKLKRALPCTFQAVRTDQTGPDPAWEILRRGGRYGRLTVKRPDKVPAGLLGGLIEAGGLLQRLNKVAGRSARELDEVAGRSARELDRGRRLIKRPDKVPAGLLGRLDEAGGLLGNLIRLPVDLLERLDERPPVFFKRLYEGFVGLLHGKDITFAQAALSVPQRPP